MFAPIMSHARRQQYRHITRTAGYALAAAVTLVAAPSASRGGGEALMVFPLVLVAGLITAACRSQRLATRWRAGADSEQAVQHALKSLVGSGWAVRSGVPWPGGGDVDHLVRSPNGLGFAIETKTRTFSQQHLRRTAATARWAARSRRLSAGVLPILCVVRARRVESRCGDVVVVSLDRLLGMLDRLALSVERKPRGRAGLTRARAGHARFQGSDAESDDRAGSELAAG